MAKRIAVKAKAGAVPHGPWTTRYDPGVPASLDYPKVGLHELLDDAAESHPGSTATIFFGRRRSYKALHRDVVRFAAGLRRSGVRPCRRYRRFGYRSSFVPPMEGRGSGKKQPWRKTRTLDLAICSL